MDSLPFNYDNASLALRPGTRDAIANRFLHAVQVAPVEKNGPRGQFFNKAGEPIDAPLSAKAELPDKANQYGWLLNGYGERGNRLLWLTYSTGAGRQSH